jgi:hypothetical protein
MFRLHDNTRRQICVALFMGLCVFPTIGVGGWAIARRLPWNRQAEEARLSAELGLTVSLESMTHTLPGVIRYTGLKLADPETGRELLRCGELEATWTSMTDSQGRTHPAMVLAARQVESAASPWQRLKETLRRCLECQIGHPEVEVRVTADAWTLREDNDLKVLENVEAAIGRNPRPDPEGVQAQLAFRLAASPMQRPMRMRILRDRTVEPPAYRFDLDAHGNEVPPCVATLINALVPADERTARSPSPPDSVRR